MSNYHLAQLNIAKAKEPLESPSMADFVNNLERINALAEQSLGFVWRLKAASSDATAIRPLGDDIIVNMSVWTDVASLSNYAFKSAHVEIMRRRNAWFERVAEANAVLWWVPNGHHHPWARRKRDLTVCGNSACHSAPSRSKRRSPRPIRLCKCMLSFQMTPAPS